MTANCKSKEREDREGKEGSKLEPLVVFEKGMIFIMAEWIELERDRERMTSRWQIHPMGDS